MSKIKILIVNTWIFFNHFFEGTSFVNEGDLFSGSWGASFFVGGKKGGVKAIQEARVGAHSVSHQIGGDPTPCLILQHAKSDSF